MKVLGQECYDVRINKILLVCDDVDSGDGPVTSYAVVMGKSLDSEGNPIHGHDIHVKVKLDNPILWSPLNIKTEVTRLLKEAWKKVKQAYKDQADVDIDV